MSCICVKSRRVLKSGEGEASRSRRAGALAEAASSQHADEELQDKGCEGHEDRIPGGSGTHCRPLADRHVASPHDHACLPCLLPRLVSGGLGYQNRREKNEIVSQASDMTELVWGRNVWCCYKRAGAGGAVQGPEGGEGGGCNNKAVRNVWVTVRIVGDDGRMGIGREKRGGETLEGGVVGRGHAVRGASVERSKAARGRTHITQHSAGAHE